MQSDAIRCPICKSESAHLSFEKFNLQMAECSNCGLVFTKEVPSYSDGRYNIEWFEKEYLPSFGIDPKKPKTEHLNARFDKDLEVLERYVKKGNLLDVGAGAGLLLNRAKERGWNVFGVEPAPYGVAFAKQHFGIEIFQGLLKDAPLEAESFDAIILQDVIEHVPDPLEVLSDTKRLLKSGGVVFLTTPNYGSLARGIYRSNWNLISPAEHLSLFRPKTMRKVLVSAGLELEFLHSTQEVLLSRVHFQEQRLLKLRKATLKALSSFFPVASCNLGDELIALASKD